MIVLQDIVCYLDTMLNTRLFEGDTNGIWIQSSLPITRLGLLLEPYSGVGEWVKREKLQALFVHRPWQLDKALLPEGVGVFAYHLPFDEHLTIGYNPYLAEEVRMKNFVAFGEKLNRPLGMVGPVEIQTFGDFCKHMAGLFGGAEEVYGRDDTWVSSVVFAEAINEQLILKASKLGSQVYVTGQFRKPARQAAIETNMHVVAIGHQRSEWYGLTLLKNLLQSQWPILQVLIA